jgi:carbamoyl-phosphate synthase small subunit
LNSAFVLQSGHIFLGTSFGYQGDSEGEAVFNTGVTGYEETLTDPSYKGQILVFTQPLIGNYGIPDDSLKDEYNILQFFESNNIHVQGIIVSEYSEKHSHWKAKQSLHDWMVKHSIPGISGIDTRAITQILREEGSVLGKIVQQSQQDSTTDILQSQIYNHTLDMTQFDASWFQTLFKNTIDPNTNNLVAEVSCKEMQVLKPKKPIGKTVAIIDCGIKNNILRCFLNRGVEVICCPWDFDISTITFDGLFISNGPGDPKKIASTVSPNIHYALDNNIPLFGICLGNQLTALAIGADTYKMKYGHRGINQPCIRESDKRCFITSQNHGFAVEKNSIPDSWQLAWVNANDYTSEGMTKKDGKAFTVQFHPESCPGPTDTEFLFDEFITLL